MVHDVAAVVFQNVKCIKKFGGVIATQQFSHIDYFDFIFRKILAQHGADTGIGVGK